MEQLAYPSQDPAELRAQAVREEFEGLLKAFVLYRLAWDRYHRAVINPANGSPNYKAVDDARYNFSRKLNLAQGRILDALEEAEVKVVHDAEAP